MLSVGDVVKMTYDVAGRMLTRTDQRGIVTTYMYDDRGLLLSKVASCPSGPGCTGEFEPVQDDYTYDGLGRMLTARRRVGNPLTEIALDTMVYNALSDLKSDTQLLFQTLNLTITNDYDQAGNPGHAAARSAGGIAARSSGLRPARRVQGNRKKATRPTGVGIIEYTYDALDRVDLIKRSTRLFADYNYLGRYLDERVLDTVTIPPNKIVYKTEYDEHRRINRIANKSIVGSTTTTLAQYDYTYDNAGNRLSNAGSGSYPLANETIDYDYDDLHRLTEADYTVGNGAEIFRYDLLGNRDGDGTGGLYGYKDTRPGTGEDIPYGPNNPANEYAWQGGGAVTYDAAGNLRDDEQGWRWRYDFENHLTHAEYPPGTTVGTFKYDALGRRIEADDAGEARRYLYDGQQTLDTTLAASRAGSRSDPRAWPAAASPGQTIAEYGSSNALLRYFVHGATYIDEHALMRDLGLGQDRYYLLKELYTVAGLANSSGTVTDFYTYDAYGRLIEEPPPECTGFGELSAPGPGGESAGPAEPAGGPVVQGGPIGIDPSFECVAEPDPSNPEPPPPPTDCEGGFGQFTLESGGGSTPPPDNPFYFTGQRLDRLGDCWRQMYDYRARSYDPWHARFNERDPNGYVDTSNLYEAVRTRPTTLLDPLGRESIFMNGYEGPGGSSAPGGSSQSSASSGQSSQSSSNSQSQSSTPGGSSAVGGSSQSSAVGGSSQSSRSSGASSSSSSPGGSSDSSLSAAPTVNDPKSNYPLYNWVDRHFEYNEIDQAVEYIRDKIPDPKNQTCPIVIIGHSWGGATALTVANRLAALGYRVDLVAVLDAITSTPHGLVRSTTTAERPRAVRVWNWYQTNSIPVGASIPGAEVNIKNQTSSRPNDLGEFPILGHRELDDDQAIADRIRMKSEELHKRKR